MSKQYPIKWSRKDYSRLSSAIRQFNKQISSLKEKSPFIRVPETKIYADIKSNIYTRRELNRTINSLKKFSDSKQQELTKTKGGIELTRWEKSEINKAKLRAERRLTKEMKTLQEKASFGTGNTRLNEVKSTLESYKRLNQKDTTPEDYKRISKSILKQGVSDYEMKKATIFQENFIKAYSKMGREKLVDLAKSFKNPMEFWDFIKDSEFVDINIRYDEAQGLIQFGEMSADENYIYELLKLVDKDEIEEVETKDIMELLRDIDEEE